MEKLKALFRRSPNDSIEDEVKESCLKSGLITSYYTNTENKNQKPHKRKENTKPYHSKYPLVKPIILTPSPMRMQIDATGSTIKTDAVMNNDDFCLYMQKLVTDGSWKTFDVTMNTTISSFTSQQTYPYNSPLALPLSGTYNIEIPGGILPTL